MTTLENHSEVGKVIVHLYSFSGLYHSVPQSLNFTFLTGFLVLKNVFHFARTFDSKSTFVEWACFFIDPYLFFK